MNSKGLHTRLLMLVVTILAFFTGSVLAQSDFWQQTSGPVDPSSGQINSDISSLAQTSSGSIFCTIVGGNLFKTTDNGTTWASIPLPPPVTNAYAIAVNSNDEIFLGDFFNSRLVRSTDNGLTWDTVSTPFNDGRGGGVSLIRFDGQGNIFLFYDDNLGNNSIRGFYKSTDDGISWTKAASTGLTNPYIYSFDIAPNNNLYVATGYYGFIYRSTDGGETFTITNFAQREWLNKVVVYPDGTVFAGGEGGFWISTDNGNSWTMHNTGLVNSSNPGVRDIMVNSGGDVYATPFDGGVAVSHDKGNTWTRIDGGLTTTRTINPLLSANNYLFAGSRDAGVFRSVNAVTAVEADKKMIPDKFKLSQNYPNPFNPSTTIEFSVPQQSFVTLKVYDLLGREVASLVNKELQAGSYVTQFNASNLASGVYLYRLNAGEFVQTKKLMLMK
jgi:photosystem II stability/assembly factor-like uncharacterized protein